MKSFSPNCILEYSVESRTKSEQPHVRSARDISRTFRQLQSLDREVMIAGAVDSQCRLTHISLLAVGSSDCVMMRIGDAFRGAVASSATGIFLVHNHPSGSLQPSDADFKITKDVARAAVILGYTLYDHVIISKRGHVSLMNAELLKKRGEVIANALIRQSRQELPIEAVWACPCCAGENSSQNWHTLVALSRALCVPHPCPKCGKTVWLRAPNNVRKHSSSKIVLRGMAAELAAV
jgi:hypothetical protein